MINASTATRKKAWVRLSNIVLALSVFGVSFLVSEVGARLLFKDRIVLFPRYHTDVTYGEFTIRRIRPNMTFEHTSVDGTWVFKTNEKGFRNSRNFSYEKPSGTVRVAVLGDSHTQGFEVRQEHTFSAIAERYLNVNGIKTEIINMGVSGFSTAEALVLLENEVLRYAPDVVVLGFFANDFEDNIKAGLFALENDDLVVKKRAHIPGVRILNILNAVAPLRWLSENSYFYSFLMNTVWNFAKRMLLTRTQAELMTEYAIPTEELSVYKQALMVALISRMQRVANRAEARFIIIDIPTLGGRRDFTSSVPTQLTQAMRENAAAFIGSEGVLGRYRGVAEFHVPNGHRHISEFTHFMLGVELAKSIASLMEEKLQ